MQDTREHAWKTARNTGLAATAKSQNPKPRFRTCAAMPTSPRNDDLTVFKYRLGGATTTSASREIRPALSTPTSFCRRDQTQQQKVCCQIAGEHHEQMLAWTSATEPLHFQFPPTKNLRARAAAEDEKKRLDIILGVGGVARGTADYFSFHVPIGSVHTEKRLVASKPFPEIQYLQGQRYQESQRQVGTGRNATPPTAVDQQTGSST
jgi:hypothetical protein